MADETNEVVADDKVEDVDLGNEVEPVASDGVEGGESKETKETKEVAELASESSSDDEVVEQSADSGKAQDKGKSSSTGSKDTGLIPRHRFNYAQEKRRAAEDRADALAKELETLRSNSTKGKEETPEAIIEKLEDRAAELDLAIEDARADADRVKLTALRKEQRKVERELAVRAVPAPPDPSLSTREAVEQVAVKEVVRELENTYDILNERHESYDADVVEEVMSIFDALRVKMPRADAMRKASNYVLKARGIEAPNVGKKTKDVVTRKRNLAAAGAQPPDLNKVGMESDKAGVRKSIDIMHMSQEDFEKLGDKEIEKLLADT